jgi:hypothetical protein
MPGNVRSDAVEDRALELARQLSAITGIDVLELPDGVGSRLADIDIDSLVFIDFLVRTEKIFNYEWDEQTPPDVFESLISMARAMFNDGVR